MRGRPPSRGQGICTTSTRRAKMLAKRNDCRLRAASAMGYARRPERHFRRADRPENHGRVGVTHMRAQDNQRPLPVSTRTPSSVLPLWLATPPATGGSLRWACAWAVTWLTAPRSIRLSRRRRVSMRPISIRGRSGPGKRTIVSRAWTNCGPRPCSSGARTPCSLRRTSGNPRASGGGRRPV